VHSASANGNEMVVHIFKFFVSRLILSKFVSKNKKSKRLKFPKPLFLLTTEITENTELYLKKKRN